MKTTKKMRKAFYWGTSFLSANDKQARGILFSALVGLVLFGPVALGQKPVCGDGGIARGEACDDGNTMDGDGCSAVCGLEADAFPGWTFYDASQFPEAAGWTRKISESGRPNPTLLSNGTLRITNPSSNQICYRHVNSIFDSGPVTMEMRFRIPATFSAPDATVALSPGEAQNVFGIIANSVEVAGFLNRNTFQVFHGDNAGSHSFTNFPTDGSSFNTVRMIKHANQTFEVFLDNNRLGTFPPRDLSFDTNIFFGACGGSMVGDMIVDYVAFILDDVPPSGF